MSSVIPSAGGGEALVADPRLAGPRSLGTVAGSRAARAALAAVAIAGTLLVVFATRWGPWAYSDGVGYLTLARNVLLGRGLGLLRASGEFQPLSMHPPLFPITLAGLGLMAPALDQAARWLNAALLGTTIVLGGALISRATGREWLGAAAGLTLMASPILVYLFSGAMSEPMFFALTLGALLALQKYAQRGQVRFLIGAGIASGLAILTRYPGVAMLATGLVAVLIRESKSWRRRTADGLMFLGLASAPAIAWLGWVSAQPGADPPRLWSWTSAELSARVGSVIEGAGQVLWDWTPFTSWASGLPTSAKQIMLGLLGLAVVGLSVSSVVTLRRNRPGAWHMDSALRLGLLLGTFGLAYLGQLTFTYLFSLYALDPGDIDQRILAPILVAGMLFLLAGAEALSRSSPARLRLAFAPGALALIYSGWFLPQAWQIASNLNQHGGGYTSQSWRSSPTIAVLQTLPVETPFITNESAAVMLWLDRPAYDLTLPPAGEQGGAFERFGEGATELERIFREEGAALVIFGTYPTLLAGGSEEGEAQLAELTQGLELFAKLEDGMVFFYPTER